MKLKVYIMTDMEGVAGVLDHDNWVMHESRYYETGKRFLTDETNAAIKGFFDAGATEILVADGHGFGGVNIDLLDERVSFFKSFHTPYPFGLDSSFDAIAWVGQHPKAGTEYGHICHTEWFDVLDYKVNGISIGEFGEMALTGIELGVTPILVCGCEAMAKEADAFIRNIETVAVKRGTASGSGDECDCDTYRLRNSAAIHIQPVKACKMIYNGAYNALERYKTNKQSFVIPKIEPPYSRIIDYRKDGDKAAYTYRNDNQSSIIALLNGN